ncbi:pantoate--beta-alanine ligase [Chitinophaga caseinilytica]|uniref:Pantothenate synthetase n=1 Tax=Chitinophaga caseinilytica TaxID=2267521 RepID=A0ABZ2YXL6_9BACT
MYLFKRAADLREALGQEKKAGRRIGFAPTMGALHQGHISLIQAAKAQSDIVVASIFVNPTQFNDPKDFEKYPSTIQQDILLLTAAGADYLFLPSVAEMYPEGVNGSHPHYDFGYIESVLEGASRPGHFQGVGIIVHKLLDAVEPDDLFMGQKDFQQCMIIKRLLEITGSKATLFICPTLREPDGLAMSSRNMRLTPEQRVTAVEISRTLQWVKDNLADRPFPELRAEGLARLEKAGFVPDYLQLASGSDLRLLEAPENGPMAILVAARLGDIRLIDNMTAGR